MRSARLAEWIIAALTDRGRAASIVGDLLESAERRGSAWFWLSFAGVVFSLMWRSALAFVVAFCGAPISGAFFAATIFGVHAMHPTPGNVEAHLYPIRILSQASWVAFAYGAARYGFRDKFTQLALVFGSLVTGAVVFWWMPAVWSVCVAVGICLAIASFLSARWRKAVVTFGTALAVGYGGVYFWLYAFWFSHGVSWPVSRYVSYFSGVMGVVTMTTVCAWFHRRLLGGAERGVNA